MQKKLSVNKDVFFLIEDAKEKLFYDDDIMLSVIIDGNSYFICQEPNEELHICEIGCMFNHFSNSANIIETTTDDLGYEYYVCWSDIVKDVEPRNTQKDANGFYEIDCYSAFFNRNIAVLFYKKAGKMYCQITHNDFDKGEYKNLCIAELTQETLDEWKQILS